MSLGLWKGDGRKHGLAASVMIQVTSSLENSKAKKKF